MLPKPKLKKHAVVRNDRTPGFVYIFRQPGTNLLKIGLSRTPEVRKKYLEKDYGKLTIVAIIWVLNMALVEGKMHQMYAHLRVYRQYWQSGFTEWFEADLMTALEMKIILWLFALACNSVIPVVITLAVGIAWLLMKK